MSDLNPSGTFRIGGDLTVHRLGFGAMRITGSGIWGEPPSREAAKATLAKVPELGIDLIDTADSYGPFVSEDLIREVLHPYEGLVIATKGGLTRHGPDIWRPVGNPDYLRQCVLMSLRRLDLERIDLWQLHRIGPDCPREVQFEAIARMRDEGLIRHVGLSEVSVDDIAAAERLFPVATVQNQYNLVDRTSEGVLDGGAVLRPSRVVETRAERGVQRPEHLAPVHLRGGDAHPHGSPAVVEHPAVVRGDIPVLVEVGKAHHVPLHADRADLLDLEHPA